MKLDLISREKLVDILNNHQFNAHGILLKVHLTDSLQVCFSYNGKSVVIFCKTRCLLLGTVSEIIDEIQHDLNALNRSIHKTSQLDVYFYEVSSQLIRYAKNSVTELV